MTFTATAEARPKSGIAIRIPLDPAELWGDRERYHVAGTIEHYPMRGVIADRDGEPYLQLGPAWCRDPRLGPGASLRVSLVPEGPQLWTLATDFADALGADRQARRFFESLASFHRKAWVTWVEGARGPEARASRIAETVSALAAGRRAR